MTSLAIWSCATWVKNCDILSMLDVIVGRQLLELRAMIGHANLAWVEWQRQTGHDNDKKILQK